MLISEKLEIAKKAMQSSFVVEAVWRTKAADLRRELEIAEAFCDCIHNDQLMTQERIDKLEADLLEARKADVY